MQESDQNSSANKQPKDIWPGWPLTVLGERPAGGEKERSFNRRQLRRRNEIAALDILRDIHPDLVTGTPGLSLSETDVEDLLTKVYGKCEGYDLRRRHNFIVSGLAQGQKEGRWNIFVPAPIMVLHREPAPFTPDKFAALPALNQLCYKFDNTLADPAFYKEALIYIKQVRIRANSPPVTAEQLQAGQIIFSAAVNGGLLHRKWLAQLGAAITNSLVVEDDLVWLNLKDKEGEGERERHYLRRWFPDPVTALLILRWYKQRGKYWPDDASGIGDLKHTNFILGRFIAAIESEADARPSQAQLLDAATTRLGLLIPPFLIRFAKSRFQAPSLSPIQWVRLRKQRSCKFNDTKQTSSALVDLSKADRSLTLTNRTGTPSFPDQEKKLNEIKKLLSSYHHEIKPQVQPITRGIQKILDDEWDQLSPIVIVLAQWALAFIGGTQPGRGKIKPSSMHNYLSAIGKHLITHGVETNIAEASDEHWAALYDKVLNEAKTIDNKIYKAERLVDFHAFLVQAYNVPIVEVEDIAGIAKRVDVNIVSPREYASCRAYLLSDNNYSERLRSIQILLLTLGYRCGLRRNEGLKLQVRDIQGGAVTSKNIGRHEMLVRNSIYADVKYPKSTRRIPLSLLLTHDELNELIDWRDKRLQEISGDDIHNQLLFCHAGEDGRRLLSKETFDPITRALRLITGDPSVHYHHLRHSFTNIQLLRLVEEECPNLFPKEWNEYDGEALIPHPEQSMRQRLHLSPDSKPSRRLMYAVSLLSGHVDPKETTDTYLHLLDWILGSYLKNNETILSTAVQANLLDISEASLKVYRSRKGLKGETTAKGLLVAEATRYQNKLKDPAIVETIPTTTYSPPEFQADSDMQIPSPFLLYSMFRLNFQHQSADSIAERYGYNAKDVDSWIRSAKRLATLETKQSTSKLIRHTHKCLTSKQLSRSPHLPGLCPAKPHPNFEKKDVDMVFSGLLKLHEQNPDFARKGLRLYLTQTTSTRTDLKLPSENDQITWCNFLHAIGIPRRRIRATLSLHPQHSEKITRRHWAHLLNLPNENIVSEIIKQSVATPRNKYGRVTIWVETSSNKKNKQRLVNNDSNWSAQGLRFALFMGSVLILGKESAR